MRVPTRTDVGRPVREAEFLYNVPGSGLHCHGPSILAAASGDLLVAWYAYPEDEHRDASLVLARRPCGGTWLPSETVLGSSDGSIGNPVLFQEPSGRIWLFFVVLEGSYWTDAVVHGMSSDNGGVSWSSPATIVPEGGVMIRHAPVQRGDGHWLLPAYDERLHITRMLSARTPAGPWTEIVRFDAVPLIQPVLVRTSAGLTLLFRPWSDPRVVWRSHSSDEAARWSPPVRTSLPNPLSGIGAFAYGDHLAAVYNHTEEHARRPLSFAASDDGGQVWTAALQLDDLHGELSYPCFVATGAGTVHGVYTYNRRLIKYVELDPQVLGLTQ